MEHDVCGDLAKKAPQNAVFVENGGLEGMRVARLVLKRGNCKILTTRVDHMVIEGKTNAGSQSHVLARSCEISSNALR